MDLYTCICTNVKFLDLIMYCNYVRWGGRLGGEFTGSLRTIFCNFP